MPMALDCSKITTAPKVQVSRVHNKRVQNEADGNPKSSSLGVEAASTADEAGGLPGSMPRTLLS